MDTDWEELTKCSACSATKLEMLWDFKDVPLVRYFPIGGTENLIYLIAMVLIQCSNLFLYQIYLNVSNSILFGDFIQIFSKISRRGQK